METENIYLRQSRHSNIPSMIVKPSFRAFAARFAIYFVSLVLISIVFYIFLGYLLGPSGVNPFPILAILLLITGIIGVLLAIYTLLWNINQQFEIKYDSIIETHGILQRRQVITAIRDIENIKLLRPFIGRYLDYGTIEIKKNKIDYRYYLRDMPRSKIVFDRLYKNWRAIMGDIEVD